MQDLSDTAEHLSTVVVTNATDGRDQWLAAIQPHRAMLLEEQVKLNDPGASLYLVESLAQDGWTGVLRYHEGEVYRLRNATGDDVKAADAFAASTALPDAELALTGPGTESGTYDSFIELAITPVAEERGLPEDQLETTRTDYDASPDDNVIIQNIEASDTSLGWVGFAFAEQAGDAAKAKRYYAQLVKVAGKGDARPELAAAKKYLAMKQ